MAKKIMKRDSQFLVFILYNMRLYIFFCFFGRKVGEICINKKNEYWYIHRRLNEFK